MESSILIVDWKTPHQDTDLRETDLYILHSPKENFPVGFFFLVETDSKTSMEM